MKKYYLSLFLVLSFWAFAVFQKPAVPELLIAQNSTLPTNTPNAVSNAGSGIEQNINTQVPLSENKVATPVKMKPPVVVTKPTPKSTPAPIPTPTPVILPKGQYKDGTYDGNAVENNYGTIQVAAVISNGKLVDVKFLQYPNHGNSMQVNSYALPILKSEAIAAQSANIDAVSGASETSPAFIESLGSALAMAKN